MGETSRPEDRDDKGSLSVAAVEASPIAILMIDEAGRMALVNPAAEELSGYRREELLGQPIEMLIPERFRERHLGLREGYAAEPRTRRMFSELGIYFLRKDGTEVAVEIGLNPVETRDGAFTVSSIIDADQLEWAGAPAREVIEQREDGDPSTLLSQMLLEIREALAHAKEGSARIRDLVSDLLCLSSTANGEAVAFDIHPVLESALNLAANEIRRRARLVKQYDKVPRVRGDASDLVRVVFNLLTNALDSIPEDDSEQNEVGLATWTGLGGSAVIELRDTGCGIPPESIDRILEPFYTTKTFGVRAGLGLSIADGILKSMGGEIEVTSALGKGSTFRVKLPAALSADSPPAHFFAERVRPRPN